VPGLGVGLYGPDVPLAPLLLPLAPFCSSVTPLLFSWLGLAVPAGLAGFTGSVPVLPGTGVTCGVEGPVFICAITSDQACEYRCCKK
jgi:hypothetical protein